MASNQHWLYFALLFLFIAFTYSHSPLFLSYEALNADRPTGRSLLQSTNDCPVDMEGKNYTIITSKCKGPQYPAKICCEALLEFCCSFVDQLNDRNNNCAETMFSYINLYGQYPSGLFANQCREGKDGLACDEKFENQAGEGQKKVSSAAFQPQTRPRLCSLSLALALVPVFML